MTPEGLALIKEFEGLRLEAYKDPVGIWTIGYGTTASAGVGIAPKAGMKITEAQAEVYLQKALTKFWSLIEPAIKIKPNEYQADAMLSLAYNIGVGAFTKSTLLKRWNAGDALGAADQFMAWNKGTVNGKKVEIEGLTRRRAAERDLFLLLAPEPPSKPVDAVDPITLAPSGFWAWLAALIRGIMGK